MEVNTGRLNTNQNNYSHSKNNKLAFKSYLEALEPKKVWGAFEEITKIYRESSHNEEISNYLADKLRKAGFNVDQKQNGEGKHNICATRNVDKNKRNAVILQAHMDMVGVSENRAPELAKKDVNDPTKPIELKIENGWLKANRRTLGADDGIGLAAALAIAEDSKFKDMPLEIIFTTDEETSMVGARALEAKDLYGKNLINLDSEKIGILTSGCAGINAYNIENSVPVETVGNVKELANPEKITIELRGAAGGHSAEVKSDTINPNRTILEEMHKLMQTGGNDKFRIASINGGERHNSIPRSVKAEIIVSQDNKKQIIDTLQENLGNIVQNHKAKNPELSFVISDNGAVDKSTQVLSNDFQKDLIDTLANKIKIGLLTSYENGCNKTSQNLGILKIENGKIKFNIMGRSSDKTEYKQLLEDKTGPALRKLINRDLAPEEHDQNPIWQPKNSLLQQIAADAYKDINPQKKPASINIEHGGLENAQFAKIDPELNQISLGPNIREPHSINERVEVKSVETFYNWLTGILENIKKAN